MKSQDCTEKESWTTITNLPGKVGDPWATCAIQHMVFSPSGRWAVDISRKSLGAEGVFVYLLDMTSLSRKRYKANKLKCISSVVDMYWVSESEFIVVNYCVKSNEFTSIYCHVDHEKSCVAPFVDQQLVTHHLQQGSDKVMALRGAEPLYLQGKQYLVHSKGNSLFLVPWNVFYCEETPSSCYKIEVPRQFVDECRQHSTYELLFCCGSKIYMPIVEHLAPVEGQARHGHRYPSNEMVCIDVNKLTFDKKYADLHECPEAAEVVKFEAINKDAKTSSTEQVRYVQVGQHLIGYTIDKRYSPDVKERTIFVMNFSERTISHTTVETGYFYFPTIYKNQLLITRSDKQKMKHGGEEWVNKLVFKQIPKKKTDTLVDLAQSAVIRDLKRKLDPVYNQFLFPKRHCCIPTVECFCEGILKSEYADVHDARKFILKALN